MGFKQQQVELIQPRYGFGTIASGTVSTAIGYGTTASGVYSTAIGYATTAKGDYSTALRGQSQQLKTTCHLH